MNRYATTKTGIQPHPPSRRLGVELRRQAPPGPGIEDQAANWQEIFEPVILDPSRTAVVVIDVWDRHWCQSATRGVAALIPGLNRFLGSARRLGVQVIFAPSDVVDFYRDYPQRKAALAVPPARMPKPLPFDPPLPPWGVTGGCECGPERPCSFFVAWSRQHPGLEIAPQDLIVNCNDSRELFAVCQQSGLTHLVYAGVHANMCVSYTRSSSIRQMIRLGFNCLLARNLTAAITGNGYDPDRDALDPAFTPAFATQKVIRHLERYFCPTLDSQDFLSAAGPS
jgi:nicotinamidase-related amidase